MSARPRMSEASCAFVIIAWNSAGYMRRCLDSVLSLPFGKLTILVFDNGSTDGTKETILSAYSKEIKEETIRLFSADTNLGTTKSRNRILREVDENTDYICVLDSDTEVNAEAFAAMCNHYAADIDHNVGVIGPCMHNDIGEKALTGRNLPTLLIKIGKVMPIKRIRRIAEDSEVCKTAIESGLQEVGYLLSACWLLPYSTYASVGPLDEAYFYSPEDVDWCARVHLANLKVQLAHDAEILHSYQRISRKKIISKSNLSHVRGYVHYFKKFKYFLNSTNVWNPQR